MSKTAVPILWFLTLALLQSHFSHELLRSSKQEEKLLQELACGNCHTGIQRSDSIFLKAPLLSYAGLRYNAAYLYEYLGNPTRLRLHVGRSRMPDFRLEEKERLALTLFLVEQKQVMFPSPNFPSDLINLNVGADLRSTPPRTDAKRLIVDELRCTTCHKFQGEGGERASELMDVGWRLKSDWLVEYLAFPQRFDPQSSMPAFFYALAEDGKQLVEMIPNAGKKLREVVAYFDSVGKERRDELDREFALMKAVNPTITPTLGEKIFISLNCAACHTHHSIKPWLNAPDLSIEGKRVKREWLTSYLAKPQPIRPFGFYPGTGSRMPDFKLSSEEAAVLSGYFSSQNNSEAKLAMQSRKISLFTASKAEKIIREELPCLGCHTFDGEGGKVGPDLSHLSERLRPEFVVEMIRDPAHAVPGLVMPRVQMTEKEQELISIYLLQRNPSAQELRPFSLTETPLLPIPDTSSTSGLYRKYCAPCHGESGNGDGYNAKFLPLQPAKHSSKEEMSTRADDTIFDGIHSGGAILNKNHRMPAFGGMLSREQIWALVRYIRKLCQCEGPAWSRK